MTLQQIKLDQSIYKKKPTWGSTVQRQPQRSLTPQKPSLTRIGGGIPTGKGFIEKREEQEALEAERKYEEKMMKLQHEQEMEKLKFTAGLREDELMKRGQEIGMRIGNQVQKEQRTQQQNAIAQQQQTAKAKQMVEANPEKAGEEAWKFMLSLPEDRQQAYIDMVFMPTSTGGTISSAGKTITTEPKYNAIANYWLDKGYVKFDDRGNVIAFKPEETFEKGTFKEMSDGSILNEATGEVIVRAGEKPKALTLEEIEDGYNYGRQYMASLMEPTVIERIAAEEMSGHVEKSQEMAKKQTQAYLTGILQGKGMSRDEAQKEAKRIAYNMSFAEVSKEKKTGRDKPLDEAIGRDMAPHLKTATPEMIEKYRDNYGDATVDFALGLNEKPTKTKEKFKEEKTKEEEKEEEKKETKPITGKDFKKWSPL